MIQMQNMNTDTETLTPDLLRKMDAYWRAANYLSVGQIYLYDNPLLREPLKLSHVKPLVVRHVGRSIGTSDTAVWAKSRRVGTFCRVFANNFTQFAKRKRPDPSGRPGERLSRRPIKA